MTTPTTNYGWIKPDIGASTDAWGGLLNTDLDGIDSTVKSVSNIANAALPSATASSTYVAKAGDTMTGNLIIAPAAISAGLNLCKPASGQSDFINGYTGPAGPSNVRWQIAPGNGTPEAAGNAGSDFALASYDNTGAPLGMPLFVERKTGYATINGNGAALPAASGAAAGHAALKMNKAGSGNLNQIQGHNNGLIRWNLVPGDGTAESSNAGSNFTLSAFNDAGLAATVPTPLTIARGTGVATFAVAIVNGSSDRRLKENVQPLEGSLDKVLALNGVGFNFIATPDKPEIGLIAQDVEAIVPEVIQRYETHDSEGKSEGERLALDYPKLTAHLIEAVKTLAARVEALEALQAPAGRG